MDKGIRMNGLELEIVQLGNGVTEKDLLVHDEAHPRASYAFVLAHMEHRPGFPTPIGVLRNWSDVPRYEDVVNNQVADVIAKKGRGDIEKLLTAGDTWEVRA
jgi:2-oxoglutarate ferredoxin oxidoreductase subunit beta